MCLLFLSFVILVDCSFNEGKILSYTVLPSILITYNNAIIENLYFGLSTPPDPHPSWHRAPKTLVRSSVIRVLGASLILIFGL